MTNTFPRTGGLMQAMRYGLLAASISISSAAIAQSSSDVSVVGDIIVYHAVLPAEMVRTYPPGSEEARMHGGVPDGKHAHHVQIALFDASTNARIADANVSAVISEVGFAGRQLELEPFTTGGAQTYGGYFEFSKRALYEINIRAARPGDDRTIEHRFEYRHQ